MSSQTERDLDPRAVGMRVMIGGVLYLDPGSAGPRRFRLPVSLARLWVRRREAELVELFA